MNQAQKAENARKLSERLADAALVVLADYRGVNVAEISAFRRRIDQIGVRYEVVKNTIARHAIQGTPLQGLDEYLVGMTGWIVARDEPVACARALAEAVKELQKDARFVFKAGYFDGEVLDGRAIVGVADMPGREQLLAALLATIQAGPRRLLGAIRAPAQAVLTVLKNRERQISEGAQCPADPISNCEEQ